MFARLQHNAGGDRQRLRRAGIRRRRVARGKGVGDEPAGEVHGDVLRIGQFKPVVKGTRHRIDDKRVLSRDLVDDDPGGGFGRRGDGIDDERLIVEGTAQEEKTRRRREGDRA